MCCVVRCGYIGFDEWEGLWDVYDVDGVLVVVYGY